MSRSVVLLTALALAACREAPPEPPPAPTPAALRPAKTVRVFFVDDSRFAAGTEPPEVAVERSVPADADPAREILRLYFEGPTDEERSRGLRALTNGLTGVKSLRREGSTMHVYTTGACATNGAAYNVSALLKKNLRQLAGIEHVKIYDPAGHTQEPNGAEDSIPACMEP